MEVKKAHGSVEVSTLMQAEAITADGIYTVGKNAWTKQQNARCLEGQFMVSHMYAIQAYIGIT